MRKECTSLLNVYFPICDYDSQVGNASNTGEIANIDKVKIDDELLLCESQIFQYLKVSKYRFTITSAIILKFK